MLEMMIKQSPWLLDAALIEHDIHLNRLADFPYIYHDHKFLKYPFEDGVYIATGPRQIGKSTHLKMLIKQKITPDTQANFLYFNCDLLDSKREIVNLVEEYIEHFPTNTRRFIFLDEITSVKDSFLAVKFLVDSGFDKNITYIITGSNTINIKKTGEFLPGRRGKGIDFEFNPMSFKVYIQLLHPELNFDLLLTSPETKFIEIAKLINLRKSLDNYLMTGGFPRVVNEFELHGAINDDIFSIYRTWITSELAKSDKKEFIAKRILERCIDSLSSDISYNSFAQEAGVGSHNTIYDYLEFFMSAYVLSTTYNYDLNQKRVNYRKNKKIYFNDPFIYAVIEAWLSGKPRQDFDYLKNPRRKSELIENIVYLKLKQEMKEVYFHSNKGEIDFIADDNLIEVKYTNKISPVDFKFLEKFSQNKVMVTKTLLQRQPHILLLPVELFLLCDI